MRDLFNSFIFGGIFNVSSSSFSFVILFYCPDFVLILSLLKQKGAILLVF